VVVVSCTSGVVRSSVSVVDVTATGNWLQAGAVCCGQPHGGSVDTAHVLQLDVACVCVTARHVCTLVCALTCGMRTGSGGGLLIQAVQLCSSSGTAAANVTLSSIRLDGNTGTRASLSCLVFTVCIHDRGTPHGCCDTCAFPFLCVCVPAFR